jgi:hypothetical protein
MHFTCITNKKNSLRTGWTTQLRALARSAGLWSIFCTKPDQSGANRTVWVVVLRRSAGAALTMAKGNEEHMSENKRPCVYNGWEEHRINSAEQGEHEQHAYVTEARTPMGDTKGMIGRSQPFFSSRGTSSREPWWVEMSQKPTSALCFVAYKTLFCTREGMVAAVFG